MGEQPRSLLVVRNPRARRAYEERDLWTASEPLRSSGWQVEIRTTTAPGDAVTFAAEAARHGVEVVAACGGDGTVNEVANGLAHSETALAVIPRGTADVWAREAFVPLDPGQAFGLIPLARRARVDLGVVEGAFGRRHFLLMCGIGLDADVVRRVGGRSTGKRWLGKAWYGALGAGIVLRARPTAATLNLDGGGTLERLLLQLVAGNTQLYGGVMRLTSDARMDDGLLDLCAFSAGGRVGHLGLVARALRGELHRHEGNGVDYLRGSCFEVTGATPLPVQVDGEYLGETPVKLSVAPRALTVLLAPRPNVLLGER